MKSKLATLAIMAAFCEAALPQQMRRREFVIKNRDPSPDPVAVQQRINQAEAKRARKAQIRRGGK